METVRTAGPEACRAGQAERREILEFLLANYNDGRRKTLFYLAANLLTLESLREIRREADAMADLALKERGTRTAALLQASAEREGVFLKLQKNPLTTGGWSAAQGPAASITRSQTGAV
ncbi:hypothetical protein AALC17_09205 [Oscillospiraceae bacterium 38-13]